MPRRSNIAIAPQAERRDLIDRLLPRQGSVPPELAEVAPEFVAEVWEVWLDESLLDDSAFQYRRTPQAQDIPMLRLVKSLNTHGQLQAAGVRPSPTHPDRYEIVWGHRRRYGVRFGGNAGSQMPRPERYRGKVLCRLITRPLSDLDMLGLAIAENEEREDVPPLEKAQGYQALYELAEAKLQAEAAPGTKLKKGDIWAEASIHSGVSYQHMIRMCYVLELDAAWQANFAGDEFPVGDPNARWQGNSGHLRALYTLKSWPGEQRKFYNEMVRSKWSGSAAISAAEKIAGSLRVRHPTLDQQEQDRQRAQAQREADRLDAEKRARTLDENRAKLGDGTSHLQAVPMVEPESDESARAGMQERIKAMNGGMEPQPTINPWPPPATGAPWPVEAVQGVGMDTAAAPMPDAKLPGGSPDFKELSRALGNLSETINYIVSVATSPHSAPALKPGEADALRRQITGHTARLNQAHEALGKLKP